MGALVVGATTGVSLAIYWLFHAKLRPRLTEDEAAAGPEFAGIIATVTSLLLAFTAVSVWDAYKAADDAASNEAVTATMLAHDLAAVRNAAGDAAREELRAYLTSVAKTEWPLLAEGRESEESQGHLDGIFRAVGRIDLGTRHQEIIVQEIWGRLNELAKYRRERVATSRAQVPQTLWAVVLIGTLLTVLCACTVRPTPFGWAMMTALSASFGLCFFFIVAMDRPFVGRESVAPDAIEETLAHMDFWDKTPALPARGPSLSKKD